MKIVADTNMRALMDDDPEQSAIARVELEQADTVFFATAALCEVVWVLSGAYRLPSAKIAQAIRDLVEVENVSADWGAVEAGIEHLEAGGDYADGAIFYEGRKMGATELSRSIARLSVSSRSAAKSPALCKRGYQSRMRVRDLASTSRLMPPRIVAS